MTLERRPKPRWLGAIFVLIGLVILLSLGTWQMQRLRWKEDLLAHIARLERAVPVPLALVADRDPAELDFVRVRLDCPDLERRPALRLYAVHEGEAVDRVIAACPVGSRSVLVDRGVAAQGASLPEGRTELGVAVVGVLRQGGEANLFTPANDPAAGRWYSRDAPAMARALDAPQPLPLFLMLESPAPAGGAAPIPAAVPKEISNRHLEYALTWYGLAATLVGVYIAMLLRRRTP